MSRDENAELREQLQALDQGQRSISTARRRGARQLGITCILLGLVLGALHGLLHVFNPETSMTAFAVLCAVAIAAIIVLSVTYQLRHRLLPAGFSRRYLLGLVATLLLYGLGLIVITAGLAVPLVVLLALLVALPLLLTGIWMVRQ